MCQNPLFNKITLATDICDRGDFHIFGVLTHPLCNKNSVIMHQASLHYT